MYEITLTDSEDNSIVLPIAPASISTKVNGKNTTKELINEGDINILKPIGLTEISFSFILPAWQYPFAKAFRPQQDYLDFLEHCMSAKLPVKFTVFRGKNSRGILTYNSILVAVESYTVSESVENGLDLEVDLSLKAYKPYATKTYKPPVNNGGSNESNRETKSPSTTYVVKSGDTLWAIAKAAYGNGNQWKKIYDANKEVIEKEAKARGRQSSSNGHWIYPGTKLVIPDVNANITTNSSPTTLSTHKVTAIVAPSSEWKLNSYSINVTKNQTAEFVCTPKNKGGRSNNRVRVQAFIGSKQVGTYITTRSLLGGSKTLDSATGWYKIAVKNTSNGGVSVALTKVTDDLRLVITFET